LARLNYGKRQGAFHLDLRDGEILFCISCVLTAGIASEETLDSLFGTIRGIGYRCPRCWFQALRGGQADVLRSRSNLIMFGIYKPLVRKGEAEFLPPIVEYLASSEKGPFIFRIPTKLKVGATSENQTGSTPGGPT
jgi:hypothetical protein